MFCPPWPRTGIPLLLRWSPASAARSANISAASAGSFSIGPIRRNPRSAAASLRDRLGQGLGAVDDEQPDPCRVETAFDEVVEQGLDRGGVLGRPFDQTQRMLLAPPVNADRGDQDQFVADVQAVDLDRQQIEFRQVAGQPLSELRIGGTGSIRTENAFRVRMVA